MTDPIDKVTLRAEVDANYDFLQRNLAAYLPVRQGQDALLRSRELIEFFEKPGDAYRQGLTRFPDRLFSIQEITDEPLDLGFLSYAGA